MLYKKCSILKDALNTTSDSTTRITYGIDKLKLIHEGQLVRYPTNFELMDKINEIIDKLDVIAQWK